MNNFRDRDPDAAGSARGATDVGGMTDSEVADFEAFYRKTTKPLAAFLIQSGATLQEAADIAQDTMIKAFQHWRAVEHPKAWVFQVAGRAFVRLRVEGREAPADPLPPSPLLRGGDIERWELGHDLVRALDELPPRQRQIIAWTLAGHTPAEIAKELRLSGAAVRQHLLRARAALSTRLTGEEPHQ